MELNGKLLKLHLHNFHTRGVIEHTSSGQRGIYENKKWILHDEAIIMTFIQSKAKNLFFTVVMMINVGNPKKLSLRARVASITPTLILTSNQTKQREKFLWDKFLALVIICTYSAGCSLFQRKKDLKDSFSFKHRKKLKIFYLLILHN